MKFLTIPTILVSFSTPKLPLMGMSAVTQIPEQGPGSKLGPGLIIPGSPFSDVYATFYQFLANFGAFYIIMLIFNSHTWVPTPFLKFAKTERITVSKIASILK